MFYVDVFEKGVGSRGVNKSLNWEVFIRRCLGGI